MPYKSPEIVKIKNDLMKDEMKEAQKDLNSAKKLGHADAGEILDQYLSMK